MIFNSFSFCFVLFNYVSKFIQIFFAWFMDFCKCINNLAHDISFADMSQNHNLSLYILENTRADTKIKQYFIPTLHAPDIKLTLWPGSESVRVNKGNGSIFHTPQKLSVYCFITYILWKTFDTLLFVQ